MINNSRSGRDGDAHGNQTICEMMFGEEDAEREITRYADVVHGYTNFGSEKYNLAIDARSWESMMSAFKELMAVSEKTVPNDDR